ncbi:MAG: glycosyltransferase, partial [bacterium]|nr:glycosyltransferase [bacterium]
MKKIALVHDYLREYGGAERVLEALHDLYPEAPVYVAFTDPEAMGIHWQNFAAWDIRTTWIAKLPFYKKLYSPMRVFAARAFAELDLSEYDVVISSSNAYMAKAIKRGPRAVHLCYCHTPPRALYGYTTLTDWKKNPVLRVVGGLINHYMRVIDVKVAQEVDYFIANSQETADRITKFYRRESRIIFPPVSIISKTGKQPRSADDAKAGYYLYVNRLALAKHPELAVQACTQLKLP